MVATKLSEIAGKGWGWYAESSPAEKKEIEANTLTSSLPSLQSAAQSAYSGISSAYSSLYVPSLTSLRKSSDGNTSPSTASSPARTIDEDGLSASSTTISGLSRNSNIGRRRRGSILLPSLLNIMHNPYIGVRGRGRIHQAKPPQESMDAVRKLLHVVDSDKTKMTSGQLLGGERELPPQRSNTVHIEDNRHEESAATIPLPPMTPSRTPFQAERGRTPIPSTSSNGSIEKTPLHRNTAVDSSAWNIHNDKTKDRQELPVTSYLPQQLATIESMSLQSSPTIDHDQTAEIEPNQDQSQNHTFGDETTSPSYYSPEETASQLAEGTLRAMRDLALDEALELHASLKYWSNRWERPVFSWFVAGPMVWFGWIPQTQQHPTHNPPNTFGGGYDHTVMVGRRVSQIQSVLARRLSAIGELQHHLLRAGWQRGVAHWGFLGEGGNWAAVDGTDGRMMDDDSSQHSQDDQSEDSDSGDEDEDRDEHDGSEHFFAETPDYSDIKTLDLHHQQHPQQQQRNHRYRLLRREFSEASVGTIGLHIDVPPPTPTSLSTPGSRMTFGRRLNQYDERRKQESLYYTNLQVRKRNGGHIRKDDQALCEWSIDALALIRSQLIRASNGKIPLPHSENWPFEQATGGSASVAEELFKNNQNGLPAWAGIKHISSNRTKARMESRASCFSITEHADPSEPNNNGTAIHADGDAEFPKIGADCFENHSLGDDGEPTAVEPQFRMPPTSKRRSPSIKSFSTTKERAVVSIANLPLMTNEVSGLLDVMEDIMDVQRARRLEKLKPPPWWRQNWFLVALGSPALAYLLYHNLLGEGRTWSLVRYAAEKMLDFAREHVVLPCVALYDEFTKGPESISDHAARDTAAEVLKKMIRSWLDET